MRKLVFSLLLLPFLALAQEDEFFDISAQGGAEFNCRVDGVPVDGAHNQEYTATERVANLLGSNPESIVACTARKEIVGRLTAKGKAAFGGQDEPEPTPEPEPEPEPIPDQEPDPDPPTQWSNYRDIPNPSDALGFDVYGNYEFDQVISGNHSKIVISQNGTPTDPYVVDASMATAGGLEVSGRYVIVQGGTIRTTGEGPVRSSGSHVVFRDVDVGGDNSDHGHGSAVGLGPFNVWLRGAVHNFGLVQSTQEQDQHGFKVCSNDVWILDVENYALSGDGVQVGDASPTRCHPTPEGVYRTYIGGGYYHDNRENGVDVKDSRDVVISGVRMENFGSVGSSHGEAIILHDDCYNTKVIDNVIRNANLGIVSSGKSGHLIDGNDIQANRTGIQLRNTRPITVTNNTIDAPLPVECQSGLSNSASVIEGC